MIGLPDDRMSEAEVSLRLALYLLRNGHAAGDVQVALDGAQIQTANDVHFPLRDFLVSEGLRRIGDGEGWQADYSVPEVKHRIVIHSTPGLGDVVAPLTTGRTLRAESKKGPLVKKKGSSEYPLMREALGQLLTVAEVGPDDLLAVAVPSTPKFQELSGRWIEAPLVARLGLRFLLVSRTGEVTGLGSGQ